jgi:hypothetical protein
MTQKPWWMAHIGIGDAIVWLVPLLLIGHHFFRGRRAYLAILGLMIVLGGGIVIRVLTVTILHPPGWDFQALWLYGHVAVAGANPYLPGSYHALAGPGPFVPDFEQEVLNVGAVYPPPTLLLFGSIGWMPLQVAVVPWMIVQVAACIGVIILLWRTFFPSPDREALAFTVALVLILPATLATFYHGQINFIAIACVLAAWRVRDRAVTGVYLVIATIMKLLYGVLGLYPLLRARWRVLAGVAGATVVASLASIAAFGLETFVTYLRDNPATHRMPSYYFTTFVNQSLLGTALRLFPHPAFPIDGPPFGPPRSMVYFGSAAVVLCITVWLVWRQPRTSAGEDTAFALLIPAGMLIYPWTLGNYFVLMLVPMFYLWSRRPTRGPLLWYTIALVASMYPLTHVPGSPGIIAPLALWGTLAVMAFAQLAEARVKLA